MASNFKYVYEIPYNDRKKLRDILDADNKWEDLAGDHMNYDMTTIVLLRRKASPTDELLIKWGMKNKTINQLFVMLRNMQHFRAMSVIKHLVDPKYHYLMDNSFNTTKILAKDTSVYQSGRFPLSMVSSDHSSAQASSYNGAGAYGGHKDSKYLDSVNINSSPSNKPSYNKSSFSASSSVHEGYDLASKRTKNTLPGNFDDSYLATKNWIPEKSLFPKSVHCEENLISTNSRADNANMISDVDFRQFARGTKVHQNEEKIINKRRNSNSSKADGTNDSRIRKTSQELQNALHTTFNIDYKKILQATNDFDRSKLLGTGGFGEVYGGEWQQTQVAIKRLRPRNRTDDASSDISNQQSLVELKTLSSYRHDNILPLYCVSIGGPEPCLVYQYMENGSLEDRLLCRDNTTPLRWRQRGRIVKGAARGIQFLHTAGEKPLIHGDIKSANILLDRKMEPKIGDFGLAREGPQGHYTCVEVSSLHGTQYYLPKEYLINRTLSSKVDTYSFGIVLFEIATGLRAFDSKRSKCKELLEYIHDQEDNIETLRDKKAGEEYKEWFVQLIELGKSCTSQMRRRRPEMVVVLQKLELIWDEEESKERGRKISREGKSLPDNAPMSPILVQAFYDEEKKKLNTLNVHEMNPVGESGKRSPVSPGLRSLNAPNLPEITENSREHRFRDEYSFKSPPSSHYLPPSSQSGMLYDDTSFESNISNCSDSKLGDYNSPPNYSTVTADDQAAGQSPAQIPLLTELGIKMSPKGVEFDDESSRSSEHLPADMRHLKITDDNVF